MKFILAPEGFFAKGRRFMFAEHSDKSFALYRENLTVPIYLPYAGCRVNRLPGGLIQIMIQHWLYKKNEQFLAN